MARDLAIDLGTSSVLVYRLGDGIVFDDATVVALDAVSNRVVAVGEEAWRIIGSGSGDVVGVRPLRDGTFTEFEITQRLLEVVMRRAAPGRYPKPRVLITIASDSSSVERRALEEAVEISGAKQVTLVEEPLAAAIGAGLPIQEPIGSLIVDIGGAVRDGRRVDGRHRLGPDGRRRRLRPGCRDPRSRARHVWRGDR